MKTLDVGVTFIGGTWVECATNDLSEADWLDVDSGRCTEKDQSFFTLRIGFEHTVTPEGGKMTRVIVK